MQVEVLWRISTRKSLAMHPLVVIDTTDDQPDLDPLNESFALSDREEISDGEETSPAVSGAGDNGLTSSTSPAVLGPDGNGATTSDSYDDKD